MEGVYLITTYTHGFKMDGWSSDANTDSDSADCDDPISRKRMHEESTEELKGKAKKKVTHGTGPKKLLGKDEAADSKRPRKKSLLSKQDRSTILQSLDIDVIAACKELEANLKEQAELCLIQLACM